MRVQLIPGMTFEGKEFYPRAWPVPADKKLPSRQSIVELADALRGEYRPNGADDGRCYIGQWVPNEARPFRLKLAAAQELAEGVTLQLLLTDIDAAAKAAPGFDVLSWWQAQQPAIEAFQAAYPGAFVACSKGGLRIYQTLAEPVVIHSKDDAETWKDRYAAWLKHVESFPWAGAKVDGACKDWTRLQRIPHDTRKGVLQEWPTSGDPTAVGSVTLPKAPARKVKKPRTKAQQDRAPYTGPMVEARVGSEVIRRLADTLPLPGTGVHDCAFALGGVLSQSHWETNDCVAFAVAVFQCAGIDREDIAIAVQSSVGRARAGERAYGWPKFKAALRGSPAQIAFVCATLELAIPGLAKDPQLSEDLAAIAVEEGAS